MIKSFWIWLHALLFESRSYQQKLQDHNAALGERLKFAEERADRWEAEAKAKTNELHMFIDALLMEAGRAPLYATPTSMGLHGVEPPPEPKKQEDPLNALRNLRNPRQWSNLASAMEEKVTARINGGVKE